ncbi:MAG: alanine racemase [Bacteriovoracaceae bacterium]|nr:alanine racemase [Bacteriovoracaceae bacterium]
MRFRSRLFVDLSKFESNFSLLKEICPSNEVLFMVKADAYGHGAVPIVRFSYSELGIKEFGTATLGEALQLRQEIPDGEFEIYVFSDIQIYLKECAEQYLNRRIIPVISNKEDLDYFLKNSEFKHFPLTLKFNTGMNRLGLDIDQTEEIILDIKKSGRKSIYHLMSHFSSASLSMSKSKRNVQQLEKFDSLKNDFQSAGIDVERTSLSNSGAIEQKGGLSETHVRPGLMMYGPSSLIKPERPNSFWKGEIISRLETYIIRVFEVDRGMPLGYGATPCPDDGFVAIIALGYGDGFLTRFQGATIPYKGHLGKIVGRVNMDMAQVFFDKSAGEALKAGEVFTVWDHNPERFLDFAEQTGTIPYELFCLLTSRVPRTYNLD